MNHIIHCVEMGALVCLEADGEWLASHMPKDGGKFRLRIERSIPTGHRTVSPPDEFEFVLALLNRGISNVMAPRFSSRTCGNPLAAKKQATLHSLRLSVPGAYRVRMVIDLYEGAGVGEWEAAVPEAALGGAHLGTGNVE